MMKIRVVIIFIIAQVVLAKEHASRRSVNITVADRAVRHNRNMVANSLSNTLIGFPLYCIEMGLLYW